MMRLFISRWAHVCERAVFDVVVFGMGWADVPSLCSSWLYGQLFLSADFVSTHCSLRLDLH